MNYLSIGTPTDRLAFAVFEDLRLKAYGDKLFSFTDIIYQSKETFEAIKSIIRANNIDIVVVKWIDYYRLKKGSAFDIIAFRSLIRLACATYNCIYLEVESYGWEKYILKEGKENKIDIINKGYGIDLKNNPLVHKDDQESVADAIMLGEAIAHQRLTAKPRQPINYKWGE